MFSLREMQPSDGAAYTKLALESPDSGEIQFRRVYQIDPYQANLSIHPNSLIVVAEHPNYEGLVGTGMVTFKQVQIDGSVRPAAYLSSLMVHPAMRRQGLAQQIAQWRINRAYETLGKDAVIFANIQSGNIGSQKNALKWADGIYGKFVVPPVKMRSEPPPPDANLIVRIAEPQDYEAFAAKCNHYYANYNLYAPLSAEHIHKWASQTPLDTPVKSLFIAQDNQGKIVAGFQITDLAALMYLEVVKMPLHIRLANRLLKIIPLDGIIRELQIDNFWFMPGKEAAASYLWEMMRYQWRSTVTLPQAELHINNPTLKTINVPRWIPRPTGSVAVHCPGGFDTTRPINTII